MVHYDLHYHKYSADGYYLVWNIIVTTQILYQGTILIGFFAPLLMMKMYHVPLNIIDIVVVDGILIVLVAVVVVFPKTAVLPFHARMQKGC